MLSLAQSGKSTRKQLLWPCVSTANGFSDTKKAGVPSGKPANIFKTVVQHLHRAETEACLQFPVRQRIKKRGPAGRASGPRQKVRKGERGFLRRRMGMRTLLGTLVPLTFKP